MQTAIIVTTYNRPDALQAVLAGYAAQRAAQFELIIADDGSTDDTRRLIENFKSKAPFPVQHVWQEDKGFRAAAIRNRAIAATHADYLLFTDGDCVPPTHFVAQHQRLAERGWFVAGNRILLGAELTQRVLENNLPIHEWSRGAWLARWLNRDINRWLPLLTLGDGLRKSQPERWTGIKTCNLAAWRTDVIKVNGLDESYSGWGLEDSDLVIRMLHADIRHKSARYAAPVFHLWHSEYDRGKLVENRRRLEDLLHSERVAARCGLNQYT